MFRFFFAVFIFLVVMSCQNDSTSSSVQQIYAGPGSRYTASLYNDNTFVVMRAPSLTASVDLTVGGTYARLSTGLVKFIVVSVSGTNGPNVGDTTYGLEIPGFALFLKPTGSDANVIPMVTSGSCPPSDFDLNWIKIEADDSANIQAGTTDSYGTFNYVAASGASTVTAKYALNSLTPSNLGSSSVGTGICTGGLASYSGNVDLFLTPASGAIVHTAANTSSQDAFIVAMPKATLSDATEVAGNYAGIVFNKAESSGNSDRMFPVSVVLSAVRSTDVSGVVSVLTSIETLSTASDATLSLSGLNNPSDGFMTGTITIGAQSGNLACLLKPDINSSGKNMILCIGMSPGNNTKLFSLLMVSR